MLRDMIGGQYIKILYKISYQLVNIWFLFADIVKKLSQRFRPENSVIDEEETKWLRYAFSESRWLDHILRTLLYMLEKYGCAFVVFELVLFFLK